MSVKCFFMLIYERNKCLLSTISISKCDEFIRLINVDTQHKMTAIHTTILLLPCHS